MPGNHPEESMQHSEHGESLKTGTNCINTASGIVTVSKLPSGAQVEGELSTCAPDGHLLRVTIPDAVLTL